MKEKNVKEKFYNDFDKIIKETNPILTDNMKNRNTQSANHSENIIYEIPIDYIPGNSKTPTRIQAFFKSKTLTAGIAVFLIIGIMAAVVFPILNMNSPNSPNTNAQGNPSEFTTVPRPDMKYKLDDFMSLLIAQKNYEIKDSDHFEDITPYDVYNEIGCQIFKNLFQYDSYLIYNDIIYDIGNGFGGNGINDIVTCDFEGTGKKNLLYTYSWGSGIHRSEIAFLNFVTMKETIIYPSLSSSHFIPYDLDLKKISDELVEVYLIQNDLAGQIIPSAGDSNIPVFVSVAVSPSTSPDISRTTEPYINTSPKSLTTPPEIYSNTNGSTAGNLNNLGFAAIQGDYIYYSTTSGLYKIKKDGSGKTLLYNIEAMSINVVGNWIYFRDRYKYVLYKININGGNLTPITGSVFSLWVVDDTIYFVEVVEDEKDSESSTLYSIYSIKADGTNKKKIFTGEIIISCINVIGDYIYWGDNIDVYKINVDGTGFTVYPDAASQEMIISNDLKYTSGGIYKSNIDGSASQCLIESNALRINIYKNYIYFSNWDDNHCIYRIDTDGNNIEKLNNIRSDNINIVGNWIYYTEEIPAGDLSNGDDLWSSWTYKDFYKMNLDGSDNQKID